MSIEIQAERPDSADAILLITELDTELAQGYAAEHRFGFSVEKLIQDQVAFFVIRVDGQAAGCGGIKLFEDYGELKRMFVRPAFRGQGLAKAMINTLVAYATSNRIYTIRLETGIHQYEAIGLYERYGFKRIALFGPYLNIPTSICYEFQVTPEG